jgi:tetratricopeptide (TPR) repeat protein
MRWRSPISAVCLTVLFCLAFRTSAYSENSEREQKILRIQQSIEQRNLEQAQQLLTEAARQFRADPGFDNLQGIVDAQRGDFLKAEASFQEAVTRNPKFTGAYLNLGRLYQENAAGDPKGPQKALDVYARVLRYDGKNAEANYQTATLLLSQGEYKNSLGHLKLLPAATVARPQALSILCGDYAGLGDREHTDDALARLVASQDLSEQDARQAIPGLQVGKRNDLIVALLESLQKRQPLAPEMLHTLGLAYEGTNKLAEARASLEKSAVANLSVASLLELARVAHKQQDYKGSLGYLAHARDLEPDNASLHYSFGLVCLDLDLVAEARNSFEKAIKLDPDNPSYNYAMGTASTFRQDPEEAVPYFEKYIKLKPQDPRGKLAIGVVLWRAKNYDGAVPWLKEAANTAETAATAHYYLGSIALHENRLEDAFSELETALKAQPGYTDALAQLGQYYLVRKDYAQAEQQLRRALEIDPDHYSANFYLLTLYTRTGDSRREAQAKHFEELKILLNEKTQELLRIVEVRPFENP